MLAELRRMHTCHGTYYIRYIVKSTHRHFYRCVDAWCTCVCECWKLLTKTTKIINCLLPIRAKRPNDDVQHNNTCMCRSEQCVCTVFRQWLVVVQQHQGNSSNGHKRVFEIRRSSENTGTWRALSFSIDTLKTGTG